MRRIGRGKGCTRGEKGAGKQVTAPETAEQGDADQQDESLAAHQAKGGLEGVALLGGHGGGCPEPRAGLHAPGTGGRGGKKKWGGPKETK